MKERRDTNTSCKNINQIFIKKKNLIILKKKFKFLLSTKIIKFFFCFTLEKKYQLKYIESKVFLIFQSSLKKKILTKKFCNLMKYDEESTIFRFFTIFLFFNQHYFLIMLKNFSHLKNDLRASEKFGNNQQFIFEDVFLQLILLKQINLGFDEKKKEFDDLFRIRGFYEKFLNKKRAFSVLIFFWRNGEFMKSNLCLI